eukprot:scaffold380836_cov17-Prasinocladus_malaysianus.AAC.1
MACAKCPHNQFQQAHIARVEYCTNKQYKFVPWDEITIKDTKSPVDGNAKPRSSFRVCLNARPKWYKGH